MTPEQLSDRLISFSLTILAAAREMQSGRICNPLGDQIVRSATSSSLNYGEARSAESKKDFIHKLSVVLKELRETQNSLKLLCGHGCFPNDFAAQKECSELIAIFIASINTARAKNRGSGN